MNFKKITSVLLITIMLSVVTTGTVFADNSQKNSKKQESTFTVGNTPNEALPEIKAWEVDLSGKITAVAPIHNNSTLDTVTMSVPNDGFIYKYNRVDVTTTQENKYYKSIGYTYFANRGTSPWTLTYTQSSTAVIQWNVSANLEAETTAGNEFLAKLKIKCGASVSRSKTWSESSVVQQQVVVQPGHWQKYEKFNVGQKGNGTICYNKYSPSGISLIGYYYETAGGWAVTNNVAWVKTEGLN